MQAVRRFLVAPSLSRLARRERGAARVTEGYFATQSGRNSHVLIEGGSCQLILVANGPDGGIAEERTDVPRAHADALLDVCAGRAVYDRTRVSLGGGRDVFVDHLTVPGPLDVISVAFDSQNEAEAFTPPGWFGPEVTTSDSYDRRTIALNGLPAGGDGAVLTDAALDSLLDTLEGVALSRSVPVPAPARPAETGVLDALRRFTTASAEPPAAAAPEDQPAPEVVEPESVEEPEDALPAWRNAVAAPSEPAPRAESGPRRAEDSRLDDVIAGLSQVLGATDAPADDAPDRRAAAVVEVDRWVGRIRRSEG